MTLQPNERYCESCGEPVHQEAVMCPNCGVSTDELNEGGPSAMAYCQSCGEQVHREAELCPNCGVRQPGADATATSRSRSRSSAGSTDSADDADAGQLVLGAFLILIGVGALTDGGSLVGSLVVGGGFIAAGLALIPRARERLTSTVAALRDPEKRRHSLSTFGWTPTVREKRVTDPDAVCSNCYETIDAGVRRTYGKDFAVAGVVLKEETDGENHYCDACQRVERNVEKAMAVEADA